MNLWTDQEFSKINIKKPPFIKTNFSTISKGVYNNEQLIVKKLEYCEQNEDSDYLGVLKELAILSTCDHPNIVPFKGVYFSQTGLEISIIMPEYHKDLFQILFKDKKKIANQKQICLQMIEAVKFIHQLGFIHLDLKPLNFIFKNADLKEICMIDFGIAKIPKDLNQSIPTQVLGLSCCCLLYTSPSPRDRQKSRMPSSA
eukprot:TRINITY_DN2280_c0_g1_i4.p2 TRINITY_DN2280_c0_g1~~TRINITY_DN2280_c0_g1_i4.p2  ORF type:complete len:200 (+),score=30.62 TRINITY_DN2280_c0_g1_i4:766-1365(+)